MSLLCLIPFSGFTSHYKWEPRLLQWPARCLNELPHSSPCSPLNMPSMFPLWGLCSSCSLSWPVSSSFFFFFPQAFLKCHLLTGFFIIVLKLDHQPLFLMVSPLSILPLQHLWPPVILYLLFIHWLSIYCFIYFLSSSATMASPWHQRYFLY